MSADIQLLNAAQVCQRLAVSRAMLYRLRVQPGFPAAVYLAPKVPRWRAAEIAEWIERRQGAPAA